MNKRKWPPYYFSLFLLSMLGVSASSYPSSTLPVNYHINCGIAQKLSQTFEIIKVGTNIPFITEKQNPDFYFGCTIRTQSNTATPNKPFTVHGQVTLPPSPSAIFQSEIGHSEKTVNNVLVIRTTPIPSKFIESRQIGFLVFQLDENDIPGEYLIDIYVDSIIVKKVAFNISK